MDHTPNLPKLDRGDHLAIAGFTGGMTLGAGFGMIPAKYLDFMPDVVRLYLALASFAVAGISCLYFFYHVGRVDSRVRYVFYGLLILFWAAMAFWMLHDRALWIRIVGGAVAGAIFCGGAPHLYSSGSADGRSASEKDPAPVSSTAPPIEPTIGPPKQPYVYDLNHSKRVDMEGNVHVGAPIPFLSAEGVTDLSVRDNLSIGPGASTNFPPPNGEFAKLTNAELVAAEQIIAHELRNMQDELDRMTKSDQTKDGILLAHNIFNARYNSGMRRRAISIVSEVIARVGNIPVPNDNRAGTDETLRYMSITGGADMLLYTKSLVGPSPLRDVAEFLDYVSKTLRTR